MEGEELHVIDRATFGQCLAYRSPCKEQCLRRFAIHCFLAQRVWPRALLAASFVPRGTASPESGSPFRSRRAPMSQGWIRVESRSKPGTYYYAHPATKKTQMERPVDPRYAQREKPKPVLEPQPAPTKDLVTRLEFFRIPASSFFLAVSMLRRSGLSYCEAASAFLSEGSGAKVTVDDDTETPEEKQRKEEARKAEQKAREEAEEREREEVLLRARQRRAQQMLEEEKRRKEEEEQEEEERQRAAERRREKKAEAERLRKEVEEKERNQEGQKHVALGRRDAAKVEPKWRKKAAEEDGESGDDDDEVTMEELERWKASEEQHEREEAEAKRRKIEEEERRKAEAELAEKRKKAEFEEAVARARRIRSESSLHKQEELRKGPNSEPKAESPKAQPEKPAAPAEAPAAEKAAEPTKAAVPPPPTLTQILQPTLLPPAQAAPNMQFPFQFPNMQPQVPRPPAPPPPPPPTPPTLANLLSGAVAKPDFGKLLKQPKPSPESTEATAGPQTGTVLWYNGRRKCGMLHADRDSRHLRIPSRAANLAPSAQESTFSYFEFPYLYWLSQGNPSNHDRKQIQSVCPAATGEHCFKLQHGEVIPFFARPLCTLTLGCLKLVRRSCLIFMGPDPSYNPTKPWKSMLTEPPNQAQRRGTWVAWHPQFRRVSCTVPG